MKPPNLNLNLTIAGYTYHEKLGAEPEEWKTTQNIRLTLNTKLKFMEQRDRGIERTRGEASSRE